jgi:hypothetical protein
LKTRELESTFFPYLQGARVSTTSERIHSSGTLLPWHNWHLLDVTGSCFSLVFIVAYKLRCYRRHQPTSGKYPFIESHAPLSVQKLNYASTMRSICRLCEQTDRVPSLSYSLCFWEMQTPQLWLTLFKNTACLRHLEDNTVFHVMFLRFLFFSRRPVGGSD